jgi:hypothetical protein
MKYMVSQEHKSLPDQTRPDHHFTIAQRDAVIPIIGIPDMILGWESSKNND